MYEAELIFIGSVSFEQFLDFVDLNFGSRHRVTHLFFNKRWTNIPLSSKFQCFVGRSVNFHTISDIDIKVEVRYLHFKLKPSLLDYMSQTANHALRHSSTPTQHCFLDIKVAHNFKNTGRLFILFHRGHCAISRFHITRILLYSCHDNQSICFDANFTTGGW